VFRLGKLLIAGLAVVSPATGWLLPVAAQVQLFDGQVEQSPGVQLVTDRVASRGIKRAQQSIAAGEYAQAVQFLDQVLADEEDKFVEVGDDGAFAGLKETARQMIRDLPSDGRAAYERAFSAAASRLLATAIQSGDGAALQLVARRYFYTPAGLEAALLLAMDEADAGRHLSAALNYQQLLHTPEAVARFDPQLSVRAAASWLAAGDEARALEVLDALLARGQQTVQVAGKPRRLDSPNESLAWLRETVDDIAEEDAPRQQWLTYRGNAARDNETAGGLPHMRVRWKVPLLGPPQLENLFENFSADLARAGNVAPVASNVIAAGDYVLTRTPHGLLAVDFRTGKRVWRSEPQNDDELARLSRMGAGNEEEAANPEPARSFARRMWEDYLYGLVSSDGARAFMVQNLPMPTAQDYDMSPWGSPGINELGQTNRLSAYELATQGKLVWEVDGAAASGELSGAFFLGAPLPVGESLYVLAEIKSAVYLIALDRATGEYQWSQSLAQFETGVQLNARRRLQAAMPSYEAGMLVCPTGAGVTVAVDVAKRSLAWAYQYDTSVRQGPVYHGRQEDTTGALARRWQDSSATIIGGRVLLTPPDSDHLHCLDLRSGRFLWKQPRGEYTRIACVEGDRILLVGNRKLQALRLENGKPAWAKREALSLPRGMAPSGTGFLADGKFHLPLTSAEVIAVELSDGKIVSRAVSRDGAALGNLICHRGTVISQSGMYLDCFDQIDDLRRRSEARLEESPDDVESLRALGEIAYNEGRLGESIALLERAYHAAPQDVEVRDVLSECLAAALDEDFVAHRNQLPLLKKLIDDTAGRQVLIKRIEAEGLLQQADELGAAEACLELAQLANAPDEMIDIGRERQTTVARFVQAQLAAVMEAADDQERKAVEKQVLAEVERAKAAGEDELARSLQFFGEMDPLGARKLSTAQRLSDAGELLAAQQLYLDLEHSTNDAVRREAIARIADDLHGSGRPALAAAYEALVVGPFADEICAYGLTGRELANQWKQPAGKPTSQWPRGQVKVAMTPTSGGPAAMRVRSPLWGIRLERTDSILGLGNAHLSARGGEIILQDRFGREFFSANLEPENQINMRNPANMYAVSRGNLLVVSLGRQIVAFNTFASTQGLSPAVMWRANLGSNLDFAREFYDEPSGGAAPGRPGSYRAPRPMDEGKWVGVIGPVTSRGIVYQDQRRLVCVDALSGEPRWSRTDVPQGCDLFGDEEYIFAVPTGKTEARVYSMLDGRYLGKRDVPAWPQQLATRGREVVCWTVSGDKVELSSLDAFSGETSWRHQFAAAAAVDIELGRYIAVVEPGGRVAIVDAADGKLLVDHQSTARPAIEELHLSVGFDHFLLAVKRPGMNSGERAVRAFNLVDSPVIDGELLLFDRANGQMRWSRAAEVVQQALPLTQPVDMPFVMFAGLLTRNDSGGSRPMTTMLILDKATGRTLFRSDELPQSGGSHCVARIVDAASHQAAVEMAGQTILLQFTDERRPPEPPALAEVESSSGKASRGLMGILLNLGGSE
jgi:outer membrane protein assembly factor BamB